MNDFARDYSGDDIFKRIMISVALGACVFATYMMMY